MSRLSIFGKACAFISNSRLLINNRLSSLQPLVQVATFTDHAGGSHTTGDDVQLPDKPKRPLSPFFRYLSEHRPALVSQHPDFKSTDVIKKCSEDWKTVDAAVKEKYQKEYKIAMEDYAKKILAYSSQLTPDQKKAIKEKSDQRKHLKERRLVRKKNKELKRPKRPLQPYVLFIKHQMEIRDLKIPDAMKMLAAEWKQLPDTEKAKYKDRFQKEMASYEAELGQWENKMITQGHPEVVRKLTMKNLDSSQKKTIEETKKKASAKKGDTELKKAVKDDKKKTAKKVKEE